MTIHTCPRCGYNTDKFNSMKTHLIRKTICDPTIEDISLDEFTKLYIKEEKTSYYCEKCHKEFIYKRSYTIHITKCTAINTEKLPDRIQELINRTQKIAITTKTCVKCNTEKNIDEFYKEPKKVDGYKNKCKVCEGKQNKEYCNTLNGALRVLLGSTKATAKKRGKIPGRELAGKHEITFEDLVELWEIQKGLCHHSKIQMNYDKHEWQVSVDRLNNDLGYIKSNIVLCCLEMNSSLSWSEEKIQEMLHILTENILDNPVNFELEDKVKKSAVKIVKSILNDIECYNCTHCNEIKPSEQFNKIINRGCKECYTLILKKQLETPRYKLQLLICRAKFSTKNRKKKKHKKHDTNFDIDYDYLVQLFKEQKGLCAYSKIPLQFGNINETNWVISLERKDTSKGYIKTNVCLICVEFNTSDHSIQYKEDTGNGGWTKDKFQYFKQHINK